MLTKDQTLFFFNKCDKIDTVKNTTTLLSANEADGFTKMNMNVGRLGVNLDKFIFFQVAKAGRA